MTVNMLSIFRNISLPRKLAARLLLVSFFQIIFIALGVGFLAYLAGEKSQQRRALLFQQQGALTELSLGLSRQLAAPRQVNALNALAIAQGDLDISNFDQLAQRFWVQLQEFPLGYINYGSPNGEFLGVQRLDSGKFLLNENANRLGPGTLGIYTIGSLGKRGRLQKVVHGMTKFHEEPWYVEAVAAGHPIWSSIYQWEDDPKVFAISFNEPIFSRAGKLQGVIGVDFVLYQLSSWLQAVWGKQKGTALIVDDSGFLVASSNPKLLFRNGPNGPQRVRLDQIADPQLRRASKLFFVPSSGAPGNLRFHYSAIDGPPLESASSSVTLIDATRFGVKQGLNWALITFFNPRIDLATSLPIWLLTLSIGIIVLVVTWFCLRWTILWLLKPLAQMRLPADNLRSSLSSKKSLKLLQTLSDGPTEIESLAHAFAALVDAYNCQLQQLEESIERETFKDVQAMIVLKDKLKTSLHAAAVAHEINQPLSGLLLNCQLLLEKSPNDSGLHLLNDQATQVVGTIEKMRSLLRSVQSAHLLLSLADVVASALIYARSNIHKLNSCLEIEGLNNRLSILGDSAQIQIALVNLLRNGIEAVYASQVDSPRVQVELSRQGSFAVISVSDNGPGFVADKLDQLLLTTSKPQGSGLGLFVVQCTMDNHQGRAELLSSDLGGAKINLFFPIVQTIDS